MCRKNEAVAHVMARLQLRLKVEDREWSRWAPARVKKGAVLHEEVEMDDLVITHLSATNKKDVNYGSTCSLTKYWEHLWAQKLGDLDCCMKEVLAGMLVLILSLHERGSSFICCRRVRQHIGRSSSLRID